MNVSCSMEQMSKISPASTDMDLTEAIVEPMVRTIVFSLSLTKTTILVGCHGHEIVGAWNVWASFFQNPKKRPKTDLWKGISNDLFPVHVAGCKVLL